MNRNRFKLNTYHYLLLYLCFYFIGNLLFLTDFPYVHSDESWLSGLSRAILLTHDIRVTEPFFDAVERNPHAIKLLFHLIQSVFIKLFGYHIFSFRLISLCFSTGALYFLYQLCNKVLQSNKLALFTTILTSLDLQYIYASHFGRQEIIILFVMILSTYLLYSKLTLSGYFKDILIGSMIGLSIGIHPNSFIAAVMVGGLYLYFILQKKLKLTNLLVFITTISVLALFFIGISFYMDEHFLSHYIEHGKNFGVHKNILDKAVALMKFYRNIYLDHTLVYYLPNIKFQLTLFTLCFLISGFNFLNKNYFSLKLRGIMASILFINIGIVLIGRYNYTSILFIFPFMYILSVNTLYKVKLNKIPILALMLILVSLTTALNISSYESTYDNYINQITPFIQRDAKVLANLNTEYYFNSGNLSIYRDLQSMKKQGTSFEEYILTKEIEYIIYYDELNFIYENSPKYNGIYGDLSNYYPEMKDFLKNKCELVTTFQNSTYGTNINELIDKRAWKVHVFRVKGL